ncbi:MAG: SigE family RNA polymerase sigma factor [Actinomycetes bacterium]
MDRDEEFAALALGQVTALRRLAYALGGDWHRADDLVQGTLERAYSRSDWVRSADDPSAYLRTILVNLAASEQRRPWRRRERSTDRPPELPAYETDSVRVGERVDLARALAELTAKQRAVVVLRFVEDRSVGEVAVILGIAQGTVKRQTHDAVRRLRRLIPDPDVPQEVPHA